MPLTKPLYVICKILYLSREIKRKQKQEWTSYRLFELPVPAQIYIKNRKEYIFPDT